MNINQYDPEKIKNLLFKITDSDASIQKSAIYQLGEMKAILAIPNLIELLNNENTYYDTKCLIIESLGKIGSSDITKPLICCLYNEAEDLNIRRIAIKVLAQNIDYSSNLLALLRFADDEQQDIFLRQQTKYLIAYNLKQTAENRRKDLQKTKDWLETLFSKELAEKGKILVANTRSYSNKSSSLQNYINRAKSITLNNQELVFIIDCEIKDDEKITLFLEVLPQPNRGTTILPPGLTIAFLSPSRKILKKREAKEADNRIRLPIPLKIKQLQLSQTAGKPFKIEISIANDSYTVNFPNS